MATGLILVLSAVGLMSYNFWDEKRAEDVVIEVLDELDTVAEAAQNDVAAEEISETVPEEVAAEMPVASLDSGRYVGTLELPVLGLRLPVMNEWNYPNLRIAPCRYTGTVYENNMVIAAHNYSSHFGRLNQLQPGDNIRFIDIDGNYFYYTVAETEIVMPTEIEKMITGDWDLTLFTCTIGGRTRVTVRCNAV